MGTDNPKPNAGVLDRSKYIEREKIRKLPNNRIVDPMMRGIKQNDRTENTCLKLVLPSSFLPIKNIAAIIRV